MNYSATVEDLAREAVLREFSTDLSVGQEALNSLRTQLLETDEYQLAADVAVAYLVYHEDIRFVVDNSPNYSDIIPEGEVSISRALLTQATYAMQQDVASEIMNIMEILIEEIEELLQ